MASDRTQTGVSGLLNQTAVSDVKPWAPSVSRITEGQAGLAAIPGVLIVIEHVAMLLGMLGLMLVRPAEYTHHHGRARVELQVAT